MAVKHFDTTPDYGGRDTTLCGRIVGGWPRNLTTHRAAVTCKLCLKKLAQGKVAT